MYKTADCLHSAHAFVNKNITTTTTTTNNNNINNVNNNKICY